MSFVNFIAALSPILFVLIGIWAFRKPAMKVASAALIWTLLLAFTHFNISDATFAENIVRIKTPEEYRHHTGEQKQTGKSFRAISSYVYILVLLLAVRYGFPALVENGFALMCTFGYIMWVDVTILICGILGAATLGVKAEEYLDICKKTAIHVLPVLITMGSLLIVAYVMQASSTGMMSLIASDLVAVAGTFYPAAAVLIGSGGSFVTGTGLGSNIMFANMHMQAASNLGINPVTVFAGQNAGASIGNMICPNNTVAACATVDQVGNENQVMRRIVPAFTIILMLYMVGSMVYTNVLFTNVTI